MKLRTQNRPDFEDLPNSIQRKQLLHAESCSREKVELEKLHILYTNMTMKKELQDQFISGVKNERDIQISTIFHVTRKCTFLDEVFICYQYILHMELKALINPRLMAFGSDLMLVL